MRGVGRRAWPFVAACAVLIWTLPPQRLPVSPRVVELSGHRHVLYAAPGDLNYSYGPKADDMSAFSLAPDHVATAAFSVTYNGFSAQAQSAFQRAIGIWAATIASPVPIRIRANFTPLGDRILASAFATVGCTTSAGVANTFYPAALADRLEGRAFCAAVKAQDAEIEANFNSDFTAWDFGTSGVGVPGQYNFMTVALHEIGHGLGFFGRFTSSGGVGDLGSFYPYPYDRISVTGGGIPLLNITRPSAALHDQLISDDTFFGGSHAIFRNGGSRPKLETHHMTNAYGLPSDNGWAQGSSYSHVDDVLYSATANGLMTWALNSNEVYTDVGPIVRGMLHDIGWTTSPPGAPALTSPAGTIYTGAPTFVWTHLPEAASYELYVAPASGGAALINTSASATALCSGGTCTRSSPVNLASGNYVWWVRASNEAGAGPWSAGTSFTVRIIPVSPAPVAPAGTIATPSPAFSWTASAEATWYRLQVTGASGIVLDQWYTATQAGCAGGAGTCTIAPGAALPSGPATFRVQANNSNGTSPWSSTGSFTVQPQIAAQILSLYAVPDTAPGSTARLWALVQNTGVQKLPAGAEVWFHLTGPDFTADPWLGAASVDGLAPGTHTWVWFDYNVPIAATPGTYTYRARAYASGAISDVSAAQTFTVTTPTGPSVQPIATYPVNGGSVARGQTAVLWAYLRNDGSVTLPADTRVWFRIDGPSAPGWVGSTLIQGLAPGAADWFPFSYAVQAGAATGEHTYRYQAWLTGAGAVSPLSGLRSFTIAP